jgi:hypothetical protein
MKKYVVILYIIALIIGVATVRDYFMRSKTSSYTNSDAVSIPETQQIIPSAKISFPKINITAEVADTDEKRELGLSYRSSLDENSGMLFVFESPRIAYFWMKDMNFPLDIIWILDNKVIDIDKNVPIPKVGISLNQLPTYSPSEKINYALEVNAGFADKNKIKAGDEVGIIFN